MMANQPRYGMVIDLRRCVGCHACTVVCKMEHMSPKDASRSWVEEIDKGTYPNVSRIKLPRLCNECEDAPCVKACPVAATYPADGGVIVVDTEKCIGCGACVNACPYDARFLDEENKVDKCDLCYERITLGLVPACVSTCISSARFFGDLNDPESEVSRLIKEYGAEQLAPGYGLNPAVYYIGLTESGAYETLPSLKDMPR